MSTKPRDPPPTAALEIVESVLRFAHRTADLVGCALRLIPLKPIVDDSGGRTFSIPREFALELAAILQIGLWERAGLRPLMAAADLPGAEEAWADLLDRMERSPTDYLAQRSGTKLIERVLAVWLRYCAPLSLDELGVDIVIRGNLSKELLVAAIADFFWQNRHLMKALGECNE